MSKRYFSKKSRYTLNITENWFLDEFEYAYFKKCIDFDVILKLRNFSHFVRIINSLLLSTLGQNQTRAKSRGGVLSWSRLFIVTMRSHDQICSNQGLRIFKICLTETEQVNVMKLALLIKKLINRREKSELSTVIEPLETHQSAYR